jgi:hypothetical protein
MIKHNNSDIMNRRLILPGFRILILLFSGLPSVVRAQIYQPMLQIPATKTAPVIDGKLDDQAWQQSAELSEFVNWSLDTYIKDNVTVFVCHDDKNLYVAFRNADPAAGELNRSVNPKGPRDTFLWGRNHVSVGIVNKEISLRLMADPKGTMTDWKNEDIAWNGNWTYGALINQSDWTAEYSIPFNELGIQKVADNSDLKITFSRSYPQGESSNWSGQCQLSTKNTPLVQFSRWPDPIPGKNLLSFKAYNSGSENLKLTLELELIPLKEKPEFINQKGQGASSDLQLKISSEPLTYHYDYSLPGGSSVGEKVSYNLPYEGSYYASAIVKTTDGKIIRRSVDYWFTIEPNRKKLQKLKESIGESIAALTRLSNPIAVNLKAEAENILISVQQLENYADTAWDSGKWNNLTSLTDKKELEIYRHLNKVRWASLRNWKAEDDFGIACTHSIIKLKRDALFPEPVNDRIDISLARNEYESFQLAILPFGKNLGQLTIEVSDLANETGGVIQKKWWISLSSATIK